VKRKHHRAPGTPAKPIPESLRIRKSHQQKAYVAADPRWQEHRRKLAQAQIAKRMTLTDDEIPIILAHRRRGRTLSYIAEDIGIDRDILTREMRARDISTAPVRQTSRVRRVKGFWRTFDETFIIAPE
jgi:hypothetical protein